MSGGEVRQEMPRQDAGGQSKGGAMGGKGATNFEADYNRQNRPKGNGMES